MKEEALRRFRNRLRHSEPTHFEMGDRAATQTRAAPRFAGHRSLVGRRKAFE